MKLIALVLVLLFLSIAEVGLSETADSLNQLQKQSVDSRNAAAGASEDLEALDYVQGKFRVRSWYPYFYPTAEEMNPHQSAKPRIGVFESESAIRLVPAW
ncbi:MAG: hypothetical protein ACKN9V_04440 [Pseudomonadota bacterium]